MSQEPGISSNQMQPLKTKANRRKLIILLIMAGSAVALYFGWKLLWFLTDDAHIAFRYISNSILGYGYVWNQPPFRPVEGYTSFLWIVLLDIVWRLFGIAPPDSSNNISLVLTYFTLLLTAVAAMRLKLTENLKHFRLLFLLLIIMGTVTNTTFLTWSSSGLETALFNFGLMAWVVTGLFFEEKNRRWFLAFAGSTALICLTRPDGVMFMAVTLVIVGIYIKKWLTDGGPNFGRFLSLSPLILPFLHLGWRLYFYGEWLPNTYFAKYVSAWPEAGFRYFASFVLEYSLWIWIILLLIVIVIKIKSLKIGGATAGGHPGQIKPMKIYRWPIEKPFFVARGIIILTLILHLTYYTVIIGGDHFEWRVYSHLIPLILISFLWMLNQLDLGVKTASILFIVFILFTQPISWTLWYKTKALTTRDETYYLKMPIQKSFPGFLSWYTKAFDDMQFWLIDHSICMRRQEHKQFYAYQINYFPTRESGSSLDPGDYPVMNLPCVGVPGWVFPYMNIIDLHGLNDYFIARSAPIQREERQMAHDRWPPEGYVESFQPNYSMREPRALLYLERDHVFTAASIIRLEKYWELKILHGIDVLDSTRNDSARSNNAN